jgi:hypothetical protein
MATIATIKLDLSCPYADCSAMLQGYVTGSHGETVGKAHFCPECSRWFSYKVTLTVTGTVTEYEMGV